MESTSHERSKFDPKPDVPVNISEIMEDRHFSKAVFLIEQALANYMPTYSSDFTGFCTVDYYWVRIGQIPLSRKLQDSLSKKFVVSDGQSLVFKNRSQMELECPEIVSHFKLKPKESCSFVGLPLPKEKAP